MSTELYFVASHSKLGELVDPSGIIKASRLSDDMKNMNRSDFEDHQLGYYVTEGLGAGSKPVGYIACKQLFISPTQGETVADIGSLWLAEDYRGMMVDTETRLSTRLVETVTEKVFSSYDEVSACVAQCGTRSSTAFSAAGYEVQPADATQRQKVPYAISRQDWQTAQ